jgi:hypothetical protein
VDYALADDAFVGVFALSTKTLLIWNNIIDLKETKTKRLLALLEMGDEITLNNHTSDGKLIELYNQNTGHRAQGLEQMVESTWLTL